MSAKLQSYIPAQIKLRVNTPGFEALEFQKWKIGHLKTLGVLKFGFGRDVLPRTLKVDPYQERSTRIFPAHIFTSVFKKKWPIHVPICPIWGEILSKITRFFQNFLKSKPILAQVWENSEKSTHSHSYNTFCI